MENRLSKSGNRVGNGSMTVGMVRELNSFSPCHMDGENRRGSRADPGEKWEARIERDIDITERGTTAPLQLPRRDSNASSLRSMLNGYGMPWLQKGYRPMT